MTTCVSYTGSCPAAVGRDPVCRVSTKSGWSTLLSGAGMLLSAVSALLR